MGARRRRCAATAAVVATLLLRQIAVGTPWAVAYVLVNGGTVATDVRRVAVADTDHEALVVTLAVPTADG